VHHLVELDSLANTVSAIAILIMAVRCLKFFAPYPKLKVMAQTLAVAVPALGWFAIVFFLLFLAWCGAGVILFGHIMTDFNSVASSVIHLQHLLLIGETKFVTMAESSATLAFIFHISFMFILFVSVVLPFTKMMHLIC